MLNPQIIRNTMTAVLSEINKDHSKDDFVNPFDCPKNTLIQEARRFSQTAIKQKKCIETLTKILHYILIKGGTFTAKEESDLFFGITRLFQHEDFRLRRIVYLTIKTLNIGANEAFIVISSLTKDINSLGELHRANAIRVLTRIIDSSMAAQLERFIKTAIIDKSPIVSSAALVCGLTHVSSCYDVVKRWTNEVSEAAKTKHVMVQFHAIALLCRLKQNDRLALQKIIRQLVATPLKSAIAECIVIRYAAQQILTDTDVAYIEALCDYLELRLRHRSDIVTLEAARAICTIYSGKAVVASVLEERQKSQIAATLTALQMMLSSARPVVRFAAIRALNKIVEVHPNLGTQCTCEVESLLTDPNRSVATLALITLLKCSSGKEVPSLMKQVSTLILDISDGYRLEVLKAVDQMVAAHPSMYESVMNFLANQPKDGGSYEVKHYAIDILIHLIRRLPEAKEAGLLHLCEFIEDSEYSSLCVQILDLLGELVPTTKNTSQYIRYIYNRLILESPAIRATAAGALFKICAARPEFSQDVSALLYRCLYDEDDEIRERLRLYYIVLSSSNVSASRSLEKGPAPTDTKQCPHLSPASLTEVNLPFSVDALLDHLKVYVADPASTALDLDHLPTEKEYQEQQAVLARDQVQADKGGTEATSPKGVGQRADEPIQTLEQLKQYMNLVGLPPCDPHHDLKPIYLTEKEAEYPAQCIKYIFNAGLVVLEIQVANTMPDQTLRGVVIKLHSESSAWKVHQSLPIDKLENADTKSTFVALESAQSDLTQFEPVQFEAVMTYMLCEGDDSLGYEDSVDLEPIRITFLDHIRPYTLKGGKFKSVWTKLKDGGEAVMKLSLNYKTIQEAIAVFAELLGLAACENSNQCQTGAMSHELLLHGTTTNDDPIACRCMIVMHVEHGCLLKMVCRSTTEALASKIFQVFDNGYPSLG